MGFGKYTKDERRIVEKINKLLQRKLWHKHRLELTEISLNETIAKLSGKYRRKT